MKDMTQRVTNTLKSLSESFGGGTQGTPAPVFDKSDFSVDALFIPLTWRMRAVLEKEINRRTVSESAVVRPIAEQLTEAHLQLQYAKEALCQVMQLTELTAGESMSPPANRQEYFYFIVSGLVEVGDEVEGVGEVGHLRHRLEPGSYIGLLSAEGTVKSTPELIAAVSDSILVKVRSSDYEAAIENEKQKDLKNKHEYMSRCRLVGLTPDELIQTAKSMSCGEFLSDRVILTQGHVSKHIFFIVAGRCSVMRLLKIRGEQLMVRCMQLSEGDYFGESYFLYKKASHYTYLSQGLVKCYKLSYSEPGSLPSRMRELVMRCAPVYPSDSVLAQKALSFCRWSCYKETVLTSALNDSVRSKLSKLNFSPSPSRRQADLVPIGSKIDLQRELSVSEISDPITEYSRRASIRKPSTPTKLPTVRSPAEVRGAEDIVRDLEEERITTALQADELKRRLSHFRRSRSLKNRKFSAVKSSEQILPKIESDTHLISQQSSSSVYVSGSEDERV